MNTQSEHISGVLIHQYEYVHVMMERTEQHYLKSHNSKCIYSIYKYISLYQLFSRMLPIVFFLFPLLFLGRQLVYIHPYATDDVVNSHVPTRRTFPAMRFCGCSLERGSAPQGLLQGLFQGLRKCSSRGGTFLSCSQLVDAPSVSLSDFPVVCSRRQGELTRGRSQKKKPWTEKVLVVSPCHRRSKQNPSPQISPALSFVLNFPVNLREIRMFASTFVMTSSPH